MHSINVTSTLPQVWHAAHISSFHPILMRSCSGCLHTLYDFTFYFFAVHLLSRLPFHSPDHLHLPCGGQEPCALSRMRTLAPLPKTTLSHTRVCMNQSWFMAFVQKTTIQQTSCARIGCPASVQDVGSSLRTKANANTKSACRCARGRRPQTSVTRKPHTS